MEVSNSISPERQLTRHPQADLTPRLNASNVGIASTASNGMWRQCRWWGCVRVGVVSGAIGVAERERIEGPPRRRPRTSSIPAGELTPTRGGDWVMTKGHRPPRLRRSGLDGKQKAQIAVAVVTTLPQLIWAIAFRLSALIGR